MRYLIISDIHANLPAFKAVLEDAEGKYGKTWCLGDIVGYGPYPNECIELLKRLNPVCIAGNHDWAVLGKLDVDDFNPDARHVSLWTRDALTEGNHQFIQNLPVALIQEEHFTLVHGSPRHPIWEYILYPAVAQVNFEHFSTRYCLVGHTHSPVIFYAPERPNGICQVHVPSNNNGPLPLGEFRVSMRERMSIRSILGTNTILYPLSTEMRRHADIPKTWKKGMTHRTAAFPASLIPTQASDWSTLDTM